MMFKKVIVGIAIFILTTLFIFFVNEAINPAPKYPSYSGSYSGSYYNDSSYKSSQNTYDQKVKDHNIMSFIIVMIMSVLVIIGGVSVRKVVPVSYGLIFSGVVSIIYVMMAGYEDIDKAIRAAVTGIGLGLILWVAYQVFPAEDEKKSPITPADTQAPPISPVSPANS